MSESVETISKKRMHSADVCIARVDDGLPSMFKGATRKKNKEKGLMLVMLHAFL